MSKEDEISENLYLEKWLIKQYKSVPLVKYDPHSKSTQITFVDEDILIDAVYESDGVFCLESSIDLWPTPNNFNTEVDSNDVVHVACTIKAMIDDNNIDVYVRHDGLIRLWAECCLSDSIDYIEKIRQYVELIKNDTLLVELFLLKKWEENV